MRAIKRLFGAVLFLALIAGAAYGYVWYQTKTFLDSTVQSSAPFAQLTYRKFFVDPRGLIRVDGVQMVPQGYRSPVDVGAVTLRSDDPLFFLDPEGRIERGEFPAFLSVALDNLAVDVNSDFIKAMQPSEAELLLHMQEPNLEALGCGDVLAFTPEISARMGVGRTVTDMAITVRANNDQGSLDIFSEVDTTGLFSVTTDLSLSFAAGYLKPATLAAANPRLKALEIDYRDLGYFAKRDRYCAGNAGVDEATYRDNHLELVKQRAEAYAMRVPDILWQAYMDANTKGADVSFGMSPVGGLGAEVMLGLGSPVELIDRLRLRLSINNKPVDLNQVDWLALMPDPEAAMQVAKPQAVPQPRPEAVVDENSSAEISEAGVDQLSQPDQPESQTAMIEFPGMAPKPVPAPAVKFRRTDFDDLGQYVYSDIRIFTYYGNRVEGRLEAVEGDTIKILQRVGKGLAIYPVDRNKLEVIEVMR